MTPAESTVRRLAAALYPGREVWTVTVPQRRAPERSYILCGRGHSHTTLGRGAPAVEASAAAAQALGLAQAPLRISRRAVPPAARAVARRRGVVLAIPMHSKAGLEDWRTPRIWLGAQ